MGKDDGGHSEVLVDVDVQTRALTLTAFVEYITPPLAKKSGRTPFVSFYRHSWVASLFLVDIRSICWVHSHIRDLHLQLRPHP